MLRRIAKEAPKMTDDVHSQRKDQHLDAAAKPQAQLGQTNGFERIRLTHQALPELTLDDIDTSAAMFGQHFDMPLMIGAMTGGSQRGDALNHALIEVAAAHNIPLALGSQRAALKADEGDNTAKQLRCIAPDCFVIGNLGGTQLARPDGRDMALRAIEVVNANALAIHLNPLQEAVQPNGDTDWRGVTDAIADLVKAAGLPVYVKEVGAGLSLETIKALYEVGVRHIEIAGAGGTNWARIEQSRRDSTLSRYAPFLDWGIPTLDAMQKTQACRDEMPGLELVASGGLRNGLDTAKAIWLGANFTAASLPFMENALDRPHSEAVANLSDMLTDWREQLKLALFLTGSANLFELKRASGEITQ